MFNLYTLEKSITRHMDTAQVPGLALAIVREQELLYARGFGLTSVEDGGIPVTPQTLFRIGSTTKSLTGTALLRLVEAGRLELDCPLKEYIDWLTFNEPAVAEKITLRMLLSHTSGLPTDVPLRDRRHPEGLETFIREQLPLCPLVAEPGKLFAYSNLGLMVAGFLAQHVYGQPFTQVMQDLVFTPLDMQRTTFDPTVAMTYPLAQAHTVNNKGKLAVEHRFLEDTASYPASFALSTVLDLANFALMHLNNGTFRDCPVLTPETIATMHREHTHLFTRKDLSYGLTFSLDSYHGQLQVGHDGAISSFGSQLTLLPEVGVAVILLYNRTDLDGVGIVNSILDRLVKPIRRSRKPQKTVKDNKVLKMSRSQRAKLDAAEHARYIRYTGTYLSPYIGLTSVDVIHDRLILRFNDEHIPLTAYKQDLYIGTYEESEISLTIGFVLSDEGPAEYVVINPYGDDSVFHMLECRRTNLDELRPHLQEHWDAYVGTYAHEDFGTYTVSIENGHVMLALQEASEKTLCTPMGSGQFACKWGIFEFHLDSDDTASYLTHKGHMMTLQRIVDYSGSQK
jgi:CubicO group peptidase (beta-lactamase class C family)